MQLSAAIRIGGIGDIDIRNDRRYYRGTMRVVIKVALIAVLSTCSSWAQTPDAAIQSVADQKLILPQIGDQSKIRLKKSQLSRIKGACDIAVFVNSVEWNTGTVRFKLQYIGIPSVVNQPRPNCPSLQDELLLELSGFAPGEPADSLLSSVRQVLKTPEEYLASRGIQFSIPPVTEDEVPEKPLPPIIRPKPLLMVDGAYTRAARSARRKGAVTVRMIVGTDGRAHKLQLVRGLGFGLDESAMRVLPLWRFEPAHRLDKAVAVESTIDMYFNIL